MREGRQQEGWLSERWKDNLLGKGGWGNVNKGGGGGGCSGHGSQHDLNSLSYGSTIWRCGGGGDGFFARGCLSWFQQPKNNWYSSISTGQGIVL